MSNDRNNNYNPEKPDPTKVTEDSKISFWKLPEKEKNKIPDLEKNKIEGNKTEENEIENTNIKKPR